MTGPSFRDLDGHDPYELLGIARTATRAEIVAAHRRQVQLVHPDRPGGSEYETKLLHIAKDVLLDPERRALLDGRGSRRSDDPVSEWDREPAGHDPWDDEPEPAESLWDSEEVTTGVTPPYWEPAPTPPPHAPPPPPPTWQQQTWQQPTWQQPTWQQPAWQQRPSRMSVSALPVVALVASVVCWCFPVGLVLGIIGLTNRKHPADRGVSIAAIVISAATTLFFLVSLANGVDSTSP